MTRLPILFLDPKQKWVDAVSSFLLENEAREDPISKTLLLDHLLLIVPTRQAGRRLRQALAEKLVGRGCVPPRIAQPFHLLTPFSPSLPILSRTESISLFAQLLLSIPLSDFPNLFVSPPAEPSSSWALEMSSEIHDLWRILAENGLCMKDVASQVGTILQDDLADVECARWAQLAKLEGLFAQKASEVGRIPEFVAHGEAVKCPPIPKGIEKILLPGLVDPVPALFRVLSETSLPIHPLVHADASEADRFDEWGRPAIVENDSSPIDLSDAEIFSFTSMEEEADAIAANFAAVSSTDAYPALGLADDQLFPALASAFQVKGLMLHNPATTYLATSSLGRLIRQLIGLTQSPSYQQLSAFLRGADARRWLSKVCNLTAADWAAMLHSLTDLQNRFLPDSFERLLEVVSPEKETTKLPSVLAFLQERFKKTDQPIEQLGSLLREIFETRQLQGAETGDREFAAAALSFMEVLDEFSSPLIPEAFRMPLLENALSVASYSLEPGEGDFVMTDGWLETAWSDADEMILAGMVEGKVPDAVVGHTFLPDRLRAALGLQSNLRREARDAFMLREMIRCRKPGAVRIFLHRVAQDGTVCFPSRLLFRCPDAQTLAARALRLYALPEQTSATTARTIHESWRLQLPIPPEAEALAQISVTKLDEYLHCPFTYFLSKKCKCQASDDEKGELDSLDFGTLTHSVLETFAESDRKDEVDWQPISDFLIKTFDDLFMARFGKEASVILQLQRESLRQRLRCFAKNQATRRVQGWRIVSAEQDGFVTLDGVKITGKLDRIDQHEREGTLAVIDYKTWDSLDKSDFLVKKKSLVQYQRDRGFPLPEPRLSGNRNTLTDVAWRSLQLPLYLSMLDVMPSLPPHTETKALYCVLGKNPNGSGFVELAISKDDQSCAEQVTRKLLNDLRKGVFWPPSPDGLWKRDYRSILFGDPLKSVSQSWIDDQEARRGKI